MLYSRLDVNLALYVARWRGQEHQAKTLQDLENTSFKSKLDLVLPAVHQEYADNPTCHAAWQDWLASADKLRCKRNDLMHGRWGIYETHSLVSNIIGLPGSPGQREVKYTLDELADEVRQAVFVSDRFAELTAKWPA
jgi:hypothetical protein